MEAFVFILFIVLGIIIAALVVPFVALAKVGALEKKLHSLEHELRWVRLNMGQAQPTAPPPAQSATQPQAPEPEAPPQPVQQQPAWAPRTTPSVSSETLARVAHPEPTAPPPATQETQAPPPFTPPAAQRARTAGEWEALIGGNIFNRVGAIALLIGVAFLLKYAFDHRWITPAMLTIAGFALGFGLVVAGDRLNKTGSRVFAQGLLGAGISILYLAAYASSNVYHLMPQTAGLALMAAVTVLAFFEAVTSDSYVVALLGLVGGFLNPVLLGGGGGPGAGGSGFGLLAYLSVLDAGLLALAIRKDDWSALEPLALAGTYLIYFGWQGQSYSSSQLGVVVPFLVIFWGLFCAVDVYRAVKAVPTFRDLRMCISVANSIAFYTAMYYVIGRDHLDWMSLVSILIAGAYFLTVLALVKRYDATSIVARYTVTAVVLLAFATAIQFRHQHFALASLWAAEAVVLVWCGLRFAMKYVYICALLLFGAAVIRLLSADCGLSWYPVAQFHFLANSRLVAYAVLAASAAGAAMFLERSEEDPAPALAGVLHFGWCGLLFVWSAVELNDYFGAIHTRTGVAFGLNIEIVQYLAIGVAWSVFSIPLIWHGLRKGVMPIAISGMFATGCSVLLIASAGGVYQPLSDFAVVANARAAAFGMLVAAMIADYLLLKRYSTIHSWASGALVPVQVVISVLVFELVTAETYSALAISDRTGSLRQMALSVAWVIYSILLMSFGIWRRSVALRFVALTLFEVTIVKVFLYDLSSLETLYRIFSFIGLGLFLLATSYLYARYRDFIFGSDPR